MAGKQDMSEIVPGMRRSWIGPT